MQLLTNCGENPHKTPLKKLISSKVEALVYKKDTNELQDCLGTLFFTATIFCSVTLIMFPFCHKTTNLNFFIFKVYQIENILQLLGGLQVDIYCVIEARVAFKIAEMTRVLNCTGSYSFAL